MTHNRYGVMLKISRTKGGFVRGFVGSRVDLWAATPDGGESERGGRPLVPFRASEWAATQRRERPTRNEEGAGGRQRVDLWAATPEGGIGLIRGQKGGFVGGFVRGYVGGIGLIRG